MPGLPGGLTLRGWCLLTAGLVAALCAVLLDERDLLRVAAFAVALPLLAILVVGLTQVRLGATRDSGPSRTPVGSDREVQLVVSSTRRLGGQLLGGQLLGGQLLGGQLLGGQLLCGRLLLEDTVPSALAASVPDNCARFALSRLPGSGAVQLSYSLHLVERGVHTLGPLVARITDPLGLAEYRCTLAGSDRLVVTPVVTTLTGMPAGGELGTGAAGAGRVGAGTGQDAMVVRSYRQGDDLRQVHWRTTARRDELMVRVQEWPWRGGVTVLLDHRAAAHRGSGPASSLEYAVSLAASVYVHLVRHGQRVRLITEEGVAHAGGTDVTAQTIDTGLEALAALRARYQPDFTSGPALAGGQEVIAVLGAVGPAVVEQLLAHRPRGTRSHAVLVDVAAWRVAGDVSTVAVGANPAQAARLLVAAGWSVTVARPDQPPSLVWNHLCISSRSKWEALR
ncbi:MAG TPA: DUF58 domain-containing protein [Pseudonocardiaceae bacterium]|nr:DUF58 domain-containing protein [Pseudonocardiaceae bacterium]